MNIDESAKIPVDYEFEEFPDSVKQFKPVIFKKGNSVCVLYGPNPQAGIFGCGDTKERAIEDWDNHFCDEIEKPTAGNETTRYIIAHLFTF